MKTSNLRAFSISDSLVLLTFSVRPPTDLFCQALDVGCHFIHGEDGGVTRGGDASKPPQQVGQLRRHRARLVAVKLGQRLRFEVLEHEVGIRPQQLHLHNRFITRETLVSELCVGVSPEQFSPIKLSWGCFTYAVVLMPVILMHWFTVVGMTPTWWLDMSITKIWEWGGSLHSSPEPWVTLLGSFSQ